VHQSIVESITSTRISVASIVSGPSLSVFTISLPVALFAGGVSVVGAVSVAGPCGASGDDDAGPVVWGAAAVCTGFRTSASTSAGVRRRSERSASWILKMLLREVFTSTDERCFRITITRSWNRRHQGRSPSFNWSTVSYVFVFSSSARRAVSIRFRRALSSVWIRPSASGCRLSVSIVTVPASSASITRERHSCFSRVYDANQAARPSPASVRCFRSSYSVSRPEART
jgi:hypothetical protein